VFNRIVRPAGAENDDKMGNAEQFAQINAELAEMRKNAPALPLSPLHTETND
jgi:hypothetical protein